jgi:translation initiation factor IF-2
MRLDVVWHWETLKELNVIIKGDVDGSVEALSDSLQKLSTKKLW